MADQTTFRGIMGNYPTGVTVVTANTPEEEPVGLTVNSFTSVSMDPMLISWSIDKNVSTHDVFASQEHFNVHVLAEDQGDLCMLFATKGTDRFSKIEWANSQYNAPIINGYTGLLECKVFKTVDAGDHTMIIGEVIGADNNETAPLLYHQRNFGRIPQEFYK
ncbi:flavin reductase family protein [Alkalicoccus daliensis]|uniref:NADH-FMN oxidoreductase RutF, flavin reductase (DIM6/NTAB) family n=1 Tax=Alkalicoccus daliensis TaxID=745820 RepID=A0A1H0AGU2_9BACI|nr:flavin reductase family protein [Alkalicoccus daliensis]SDN32818.1 NADH-FMN oxidoreductase RutF, flavin reductase (DIM6/NTAB) family [Alkalicoccus daliensis]